ncbi:hypothetical protein C8Q76DRAFT_228835 [Earliella scabrosa]|nr:hypothetical protein C8Q76DRAFT_228835 [Earliella scabrosa]
MTFADLSWYDGKTRLLLILGNPVYPSAQSRFVSLPLYSAGSRHQTRLARVDDPCAYYHHLSMHAVLGQGGKRWYWARALRKRAGTTESASPPLSRATGGPSSSRR